MSENKMRTEAEARSLLQMKFDAADASCAALTEEIMSRAVIELRFGEMSRETKRNIRRLFLKVANEVINDPR